PRRSSDLTTCTPGRGAGRGFGFAFGVARSATIRVSVTPCVRFWVFVGFDPFGFLVMWASYPGGMPGDQLTLEEPPEVESYLRLGRCGRLRDARDHRTLR